jgi:hypothetical protein
MGVGSIDETTPLERIVAAVVVGAMLWLGMNWVLALTHTLTRVTLLCGASVLIVAAVILLWRRVSLPGIDPFAVAVCVPIALWVAYVLWRGLVLPPDNHDALAYHFPKAVFIAQTHGYGYFSGCDPRVTVLPANYELLLSDVLMLTGTDHITEWISTFFYICFLLATGAAVQRWFGRGLHVVAAVIATAAAPVLLLHSGADKNDLMTCFFAIAALMWGARWCVQGGRMPWLLTIASLVLAGGTKPHAAAVLAGLAPFMIARAVRHRPRARDVALTAVFAAIVFFLGGGAVYVFNYLDAPNAAEASGLTPNFVGYGDWANVWRYPYLVLAEPFSRNESFVWLPWRHEAWFWPRYELFFSGFGPLFTILVCAIPYCVYKFREKIPERFVFSIAALIATFLIMPLQFRPLGFFGGLPRFTAFLMPAVMGYSIAPLVKAFPRRAIAVALSLYFIVIAVQCALYDRYSPLEYAQLAAKTHTRSTWTSRWRASNVLDRVAGPEDTVAIDCGFDTWVYPAMGEWHSRRIEFIRDARIPANAQWVMVDRWWNTVWGSMTDLGQIGRPMRVQPVADDTRIIRTLLQDPRFAVVYLQPRFNQAVFRRVR